MSWRPEFALPIVRTGMDVLCDLRLDIDTAVDRLENVTPVPAVVATAGSTRQPAFSSLRDVPQEELQNLFANRHELAWSEPSDPDMDIENADSSSEKAQTHQANARQELFTGGRFLATHMAKWFLQLRDMGVSPRIICERIGLDSPAMTGLGRIPESQLWKLLMAASTEVGPASEQRPRVRGMATPAQVAKTLQGCNRIIVLSGAGISVSAGIPDFRSRGGIYSMMGAYPFSKPEDMFDLHFFRGNPFPFYHFAKIIMPGQFQPTLAHHFIAALQNMGKLQRNYTQNIDGLENQVGLPPSKIVQCHGTFETAHCLRCRRHYSIDVFSEHIMKQRCPLCPACMGKPVEECYIEPPPDALQRTRVDVPDCIVKPDIVFFQEDLQPLFDTFVDDDLEAADMLVVIGSSCQVRPVAGLLGRLPRHIPQVLINRDLIDADHQFDVVLLGEADEICLWLAQEMGLQIPSDVVSNVYKPELHYQLNKYKGREYIWRVRQAAEKLPKPPRASRSSATSLAGTEEPDDADVLQSDL